jgi:3-oxoacyl-[acyl-carrier-protein] synthase II
MLVTTHCRPKVAVTGIGLVTSFGVSLETYWKSLLEGASGISPVTHFDPSGLPCRIAAYLKDTQIGDHLNGSAVFAGEPRFALFALLAARMASESSGWMGCFDRERTGIFLGTSGERPRLAQMAEVAYQSRGGNGEVRLKNYVQGWEKKLGKGDIARLLPQYASARLAIQFGIQGPVVTINTACTSSANAIGEAMRAIQRGTVDLAIAGGSECLVSQIGLQIFSTLRVLSQRNTSPESASRPFDLERDGFVLGEGAGILILERYDLAAKRGASVLAELAGYGTSCDAYRVTDEAPDGRGAVLAMRRALEDAELSAQDIDYINAHGTSTVMNDRLETLAIKSLFGERAYRIPISSIKSMIGHTISAAGAIELITCVLSLRDGLVPPTINYQFRDPDCDLDYVPNEARSVPLDAVLSNSFGFGGHNDCLVLKRALH